MSTHHSQNLDKFPEVFRQWRKERRMSQLELALTAEVSQRHISWLETGRSKPSKEMILKLSNALDIPLRDQNTLLNLAGFSKLYSEGQLDEPSMNLVSGILHNILRHNEPYPVFVLDKYWNIKMQNSAASKLFSLLGDPEEVWRNLWCIKSNR